MREEEGIPIRKENDTLTNFGRAFLLGSLSLKKARDYVFSHSMPSEISEIKFGGGLKIETAELLNGI